MRAAFGNALRRIDSSNPAAASRDGPNTGGSATPTTNGGGDAMNWRAFASTIGTSVRSAAKTAYEAGSNRVVTIQQSDTWQQWNQRRKEEIKGVEKLALFPGYAVKRPLPNSDQFSLEIFVDGYASTARPPELATRSQKAFMRLAKGFAALPKLPLSEVPGGTLVPDFDETRSIKSNDDDAESLFDFEELKGHLPPRPDQMDDDLELAALQRNPEVMSSLNADARPTTPGQAPPHHHIPHTELAKLHANLDARLQPFWASILPNRTVRISVFVSNHHDEGVVPTTEELSDLKPGALVTRDVMTNEQGYFSNRFKLSFEDICTHPTALPIAYDDGKVHEHYLLIKVQLQPPPEPENPANARPPLSPTQSISSVNSAGAARPPLPPRPASSSSTPPIATPPAKEPTPSIRSLNMSANLAGSRNPWEPSALVRDELAIVICNRSAAYAAAEDYISALVDADVVIQLKRPWSKGHFRKAKALMGLHRYEEARDAVMLGLQFEPDSAEMLSFKKDIDELIEAQDNAARSPTSPLGTVSAA